MDNRPPDMDVKPELLLPDQLPPKREWNLTVPVAFIAIVIAVFVAGVMVGMAL